MSRPKLAERSQPGIHLLKGFGSQPVETALGIHRGFDETRLAEHSQVFGHRRLRHPELPFDLSHRLFGRHQKAQDRAAVWLRNDFEHRSHCLDIPHREYACQGIYGQRDPSAHGRPRDPAPCAPATHRHLAAESSVAVVLRTRVRAESDLERQARHYVETSHLGSRCGGTAPGSSRGSARAGRVRRVC